MSVILDPATLVPAEERAVALTAVDAEQLLVRWLGEVLYLYDAQRFACGEFSVRLRSATSLEAVIRGEIFDPARHAPRLDVKAVTYHQVTVDAGPAGATVRVFLDI
jgi:SHS2 domain-containing protein